jgi:hypothetical protein
MLLEHSLQVPFGIAGFGRDAVQRQRLIQALLNPGQKLTDDIFLVHGLSSALSVMSVLPQNTPVALTLTTLALDHIAQSRHNIAQTRQYDNYSHESHLPGSQTRYR